MVLNFRAPQKSRNFLTSFLTTTELNDYSVLGKNKNFEALHFTTDFNTFRIWYLTINRSVLLIWITKTVIVRPAHTQSSAYLKSIAHSVPPPEPCDGSSRCRPVGHSPMECGRIKSECVTSTEDGQRLTHPGGETQGKRTRIVNSWR